MHVVAFNGSPRKGGNTSQMIDHVFVPLNAAGITTEEIRLGGNKVRGCIGCMKCQEKSLGKCVFDDDPINSWIEHLYKADGIILASPTYFANVTTEMKAFMDRAGYSARACLVRKVGAPVVVARRGGAIQTYNALMSFFGISQMIVPGSIYWNMGYGRLAGEVQNDAEAIRTMTVLGENMAWLMQKLEA